MEQERRVIDNLKARRELIETALNDLKSSSAPSALEHLRQARVFSFADLHAVAGGLSSRGQRSFTCGKEP